MHSTMTINNSGIGCGVPKRDITANMGCTQESERTEANGGVNRASRTPLVSALHAYIAIALCVVSNTAFAQIHKCASQQDTITYQDSPCKGAKAMASALSAPALSSLTQLSGASIPSMPNQAAKVCSENWLSTLKSVEIFQMELSKIKHSGSRDKIKKMEADHVSKFLRPCSQHGFVTPDTPDQITKNNALAVRIDKKYKVAYEQRLAFEVVKRTQAPQPAHIQAVQEEKSAHVTGVTGPTEEEHVIHQCADEWETQMNIRSDLREHTARERARGYNMITYDKFNAERDQIAKVRFLPKCAKLGFEWPTDSAGEARNNKIMEKVRRKADAILDARERGKMRQQIERAAEERLREAVWERDAEKNGRRITEIEGMRELR